jgi:carbon-monoxide dehydrogenase large subunit
VQLGIGVSAYVEVTAPLGLHTEYGSVEIHADGRRDDVASARARDGQGHAHGVRDARRGRARHRDGEAFASFRPTPPPVPTGVGHLGSRSLQTRRATPCCRGGQGRPRAGRELAAHLLEASPEDIVVGEGGLHRSGGRARRARLAWGGCVAEPAVARRPRARPAASRGRLRSGTNSTFPFGAHVSVVEVDTETGKVTMRSGTSRSTTAGGSSTRCSCAGQQHGGIAQGSAGVVGGVRYDADGNPLTTNLRDYCIPSAAERVTSFEASNTETPTPYNPLGAKGIGESGTIGSTPAIQNAVVDALSHLGVTHIDMPCTPERVWRALETARSAPGG